MAVPLRQSVRTATYLARQRLARREQFPLLVELEPLYQCNLACAYCYADEGRFGGAPRRMSAQVARRAVDELLDSAAPGDCATARVVSSIAVTTITNWLPRFTKT